MLEKISEGLERAFNEEIATHPEMKEYLWLGVVVIRHESFPAEVGFYTTRNPFVHIRNSLWGFYRCKPIASGAFSQLERESSQVLHDLFVYLSGLSYDGLYMRLLGDASQIHIGEQPLMPSQVVPFVRLLEGQVLRADLIQEHLQGQSAMQWIQNLLALPGNFYSVETIERPPL
ncbi:hypothetical protein [Sulfobacillus harzensis]|uniref:Uncharacterized protein n=1 Tax=Sulfobacillus harzensis TaxID=2729629 RepID=A0A7Y0Q4G1_9FIRM|nr:hypothetical protein [Sulfobacillus harzensis]NMP23986.1 hypothetical protein [Sulfobacillus harzensis]